MVRLAIVFFIALFFINPYFTNAQCIGFTKKHCVPELKPYVFNGQMHSTVLNEGDIAELVLTFYAEQDYRIFICSQEILGTIEFKLLDENRKQVFNNKEFDYLKHWDFKSTTTQQLIVQVTVPQSDNPSKIVQSGCVSILIGFKE